MTSSREADECRALERGGVLTHADLAAHATSFPEPISTTYRGEVTVWEMPPPNHGLGKAVQVEPVKPMLKALEAKM